MDLRLSRARSTLGCVSDSAVDVTTTVGSWVWAKAPEVIAQRTQPAKGLGLNKNFTSTDFSCVHTLCQLTTQSGWAVGRKRSVKLW